MSLQIQVPSLVLIHRKVPPTSPSSQCTNNRVSIRFEFQFTIEVYCLSIRTSTNRIRLASQVAGLLKYRRKYIQCPTILAKAQLSS